MAWVNRLGTVSEQASITPSPMPSASLDELARLQDARPVEDLGELATDLWVEEHELEAFLTDLHASPDGSLT